MNKVQVKHTPVSSTGSGLSGSLRPAVAKNNAKPQHCAMVTIKVDPCETLSPVFLRLRKDQSPRTHDTDRQSFRFSLGVPKQLSSSLESLASLPDDDPPPAHSTKRNQHLPFPNGGGNLLLSKPLSSSQILSPGNRNDDADFAAVSPTVPSHLARLIQDKILRAIILDCRTFLSYNTNHITGALNVSCADAISRKRLSCGRTTIADLVNGPPDAKDLYKKAVNDGWEFLVYDDNAADIKLLPAAHPLKVVVTCLQKSGLSVTYLLGGLQAFYKSHSHLCSQPSAPPSRPLLYSPTTPQVDSGVDSAKISQILLHLYLGNERDAADRELLNDLGITHILNVTSHVPLHFEKEQIKYKRLPASDSGNQNLKQYFKEAIQFIDDAERHRGRVLVHCQAGVSRSSTIAIAYVMVRLSMTMLEAFHFVKSKRSIVAPNFNFMGQLLDFEGLLGRESSEKTTNKFRK